ncbi:MAG: OsmC family protein [Candidatus Izemoplasma sp.]|nr:OsmC family protein [Candidatus Izemoplasma sp.]
MANKVNVTFLESTEGVAKTEHFHTDISFTGKAFAPYELLLSGFASCLHATFMGIAKKMKVDYESVNYDVTGEKREKVPTFLKHVLVKVTVTGVEENQQNKFKKAMETAERYCSISAMIAKVAELEFEFKFE